MRLAGMNVDDPEVDLVGFSIEASGSGDASFKVLHIELRSGQQAGMFDTDGRDFPSTEVPFQNFRRIHFPWSPEDHDRLRGWYGGSYDANDIDKRFTRHAAIAIRRHAGKNRLPEEPATIARRPLGHAYPRTRERRWGEKKFFTRSQRSP